MTLRKPCCFLLLFGVLPVMAQRPMSEYDVRALYQTRNQERQRLWDEKKFEQAVALLEEIVATPAMMNISDLRLDARYNLACGYSLLGQKQKSLTLLRDIVAGSRLDPAGIEKDTDFDNIRAEPAYKEIIAAARADWERAKHFWDAPALLTRFQQNLPEDEKIAGLAHFWSEAKYNFAWFDKLPDLDWDSKMLEFLPRVRATKSTAEYYRVMMEFAALLKDGHTDITVPRELSNEFASWPSVRLALVEGRVLVARVLSDETLQQAGVRRGIELTDVEGLPVREYAARFVAPSQTGSSEQDREHRTLVNALLAGPRDSRVRLRFRDEQGRTFEVSATRFSPGDLNRRDTAPRTGRFEFRPIDDGRIAYVALNSFIDGAIVGDFEKAWPEIRKAPALILDVRANSGGSSGYGNQILGYLAAKGGPVAATRTRLYRPAFRAWGRGEAWQEQTWSIDAKGEGYPGRMVLLTSPYTFSAAEDFASSFDTLNAGIIIGEPTGGSTGQPLSFRLPGGGYARVCTLQERYADGREFVGTGIQPKIRVAPAVEDFRAGKDTVLDAALAYLRH
jgi:carboxyl-terminal processing protease